MVTTENVGIKLYSINQCKKKLGLPTSDPKILVNISWKLLVCILHVFKSVVTPAGTNVYIKIYDKALSVPFTVLGPKKIRSKIDTNVMW